MGPVRASVVGLLAHVVQCLLLSTLDAAEVRWSSVRLLLVPAAAVIASLAADRFVDAPNSSAVCVAASWLAAGLVHHYATGITAAWDGEAVRGSAHLAWDLGFHVPPLLLAALATRPVPFEPSEPE